MSNENPVQAESALLSRRRRRKSLPSRNGTDPTSPEVISSLISSLSTISVPLNSHFDTIPKIDESDPALPEVPRTAPIHSLPPSEQHGFGMSYGNYKSAVEQPALPENPFLHPDDAASSPVIRMARAPPSPKSPRSPRFKPFKTTDPSSTRPASRESYTSVIGAPEPSSFGTISTEPGPRLSTPSIASNSSAGRAKSLKSQFSQLKRSSRELLCEKDPHVDRLRKTTSYNDSLRHNIPRSRASLRSLHSMAEVREEARPADVKEEPYEAKVARTPPIKDYQSFHDTPDAGTPGGIGSGRIIPTRDSSLRHRNSQSSTSKKHRSAHHSRYSSTASKELNTDNGTPGTNNDAEQVTRRIQELKDQQQKIKTELEVGNSPEHPTKTSPVKQTRASKAKASRVLGYDVDQAMQEEPGRNHPSFSDSAPSPNVMTGKNRTGSRLGAPITPKSTHLPPQFPKSPTENLDSERARYRQSLEPNTHRRTPSGHLSHVSNGRPSYSTERPSSADSIDLAVEDYVFSPKLTQRVIHPTTGRSIAFSEVGHPKGHVVICCVGMGLTRYLMAFYDELARTLNLRLVTLDRPGVGESGPHQGDEPSTPLSWPDDVAIVCNYLRVTKFSILAHSAGAIYALATALRIPQHIRGRIHLLAPWIPPSQLSNLGSKKDPAPTNAVPYSQKILRALPTSFLKVANSSFMSATSASITTSLPKSPRRTKRKVTATEASNANAIPLVPPIPSVENNQQTRVDILPNIKPFASTTASYIKSETALGSRAKSPEDEGERQRDYDTRLTYKIWELATTNANPAVDLLICLERRQTIGFRYVDITRSVVIHHGSKDPRVPVENVQWLGKTMRRCEVRILEGEGHGLMASAGVMGNVLTEIAKEWEDWTILVQGKRRATVSHAARPGLSIHT
ncbi:hypothetical protein DTO013E5_8088 [Penicillium roqueforti]|uniref:Genomic scaffold, ProqFM164S02 n=1 Tax=Penicillium roqueforti (strain FM164) TaxID=1365484 RepID=W6Q164_PENRF|nr:uncharacterized protein LCP9604111_4649 [Penicillium roqueforti]CDM30060.1 unnamed protein product [Penicillium roqueforti FM164]KAF9248933.1 hypothetical protein LCP9604111_4649 [Penicillium roqueforti]KAI1831866.1 hypothetical protein CBS147337_7312 [Penicillium roqueforti]KAI2670091.1 hypothetical protein CBS147355_9504 [Penicillium roqueforti]KAI2677655.1 hypothetical protein LCP963914a_7947 [Penicillium roqueforti]